MKEPLRQAFIGLGANLGDRAVTLRGAVGRLREALAAVEVSRVYETAPVGVTEQPSFLNLVAGVETALAPEDLLRLLLGIEAEFGRVRIQRWGPRTLDLDLLAYEGEVRATPLLELPHPRMLERTFVTVPLREVLQRPRFQRESWAGLRARIEALPAPDPAPVGADIDLR
ncbi:MAG: 2-amino-4-hydroxy-6-hydroxymethyldihydropteridine diphosphokinase [Opitutales bacterium]